MAKSLSSENIRLPNDLIQPMKRLNEIFRSGQQEEVLRGLDTLITALGRREAIASYNGIDGKLNIIVEKLDQLQRQPAAVNHQMQVSRAVTPDGKIQQQQTIATAPPPRPVLKTVQIRLDHGTYAAHTFNTPEGQQRFVMAVWREVPETWLPDIERQVRVSGSWGMPPFKLEVAG
jgi:hypothetical protein